MKSIELLGLALLLGGFLSMLATALGHCVVQWKTTKLQQTDATGEATGRSAEPGSGGRARKVSTTLWILLAITIAGGTFLRLSDLDAKTLSHPEAYVPGIELIAGISEPPPRNSIKPLLWFHFHREPHPPAYYFMMFGWTKVFGTGIDSLRMPSVLFGILCIILVFQIGRELFDGRVGVLSAALVAFNGHHIYWSQSARMYAMTCFLGLLSALFLIRILREADESKRVCWGAAYVLTSCLGVYTEILFWPLLAGQMLFVLGRQAESRVGLLLRLQSIVVMIGAPMWAHAYYRARESPLEGISATFIGEFLSFGFLFSRDWMSLPNRAISGTYLILITAFALLCLAFAFYRRNGTAMELPLDKGPVAALKPKLIAVLSVITLFGFNLLAERRHKGIFLCSLIPLAAYFLPGLADRARRRLKKYYDLFACGFWADRRFLLISLSLIPAIIVGAVSIQSSLIATRLFLVFTPFLLILLAAGTVNLIRNRILIIPVFLVLILLHGGSIQYFRQFPSEAVNYEALAEKIKDSARKGDVVFVQNRSWAVTPIFHYLKKEDFTFVATRFKEATENPESQRAWLVKIEGEPPTTEMLQALGDFRHVLTVSSLRGRATLYQRARAPDR